MRDADPRTIAMVARCRERSEPSQLYVDLNAEELACVNMVRPEPPYEPMAKECLAPSDRGVEGAGDFEMPSIIVTP